MFGVVMEDEMKLPGMREMYGVDEDLIWSVVNEVEGLTWEQKGTIVHVIWKCWVSCFISILIHLLRVGSFVSFPERYYDYDTPGDNDGILG